MLPIESRNEPAIELINVSRRFLSPQGKSFATLNDFNLTVAKGEFIALVGPTGCGKSTTLNLITGLGKPSSGEVRVMGQRVQGIDPQIGFVFQADALFPWRTVLENVIAGPLFRGEARYEATLRGHDWINRVGLSAFEGHYPYQLSGGMRKRVALAQTFINRPKILLMDEPFSALDVQTRVQMHEELLAIWSEAKASVVFVTHDLEEAIGLADKVYVLTSRPATIKSVHKIDIPRPRLISEIRYHKKFIDLSRLIWRDLKEEVQSTYSAAERL